MDLGERAAGFSVAGSEAGIPSPDAGAVPGASLVASRRRSRSPSGCEEGDASRPSRRSRASGTEDASRAHTPQGAEIGCGGMSDSKALRNRHASCTAGSGAGEEHSGQQAGPSQRVGPCDSPPQPPLPAASNPPARLASDLNPAVALAAIATIVREGSGAAAGAGELPPAVSDSSLRRVTSALHRAISGGLLQHGAMAAPDPDVSLPGRAASAPAMQQYGSGLMLERLPYNSALVQLGQRLAALCQAQQAHAQQQQQQVYGSQQAQQAEQASQQAGQVPRSPFEAAIPAWQEEEQEEMKEEQGELESGAAQDQAVAYEDDLPIFAADDGEDDMMAGPEQAQQQQVLPLRPGTPLQRRGGDVAAGLLGLGTSQLQELYRSCCARYEAELCTLKCQLAVAEQRLTLQDGARVQLAAELGWARDAARSAQAQRSAMKLLAAKNAELQEQVRQLSIRQHTLQQQLVAAMSARERKHAEAAQLAADKEALAQQLADSGARQRALHQQVAALDARTSRAEQELQGVQAARDWLGPQLERAFATESSLREELAQLRSLLAAAGVAPAQHGTAGGAQPRP